MEFNSNDDLRKFAKLLADKMESLGHHSIAHDLNEWRDTSFTILSEFLEELWLILKRVESLNIMDLELKQQVGDCKAAIDKAFDQGMKSKPAPKRLPKGSLF